MGIYLNPTNDKFFKAVNSEIYIDKTDLIRYTNKVLAAVMLTAYYSRSADDVLTLLIHLSYLG